MISTTRRAREAFVEVEGGRRLLWAAIDLAIDLELRGFSLSTIGDGLHISPRRRLSKIDVDEIHRQREALLDVVRYNEFCEATR